jgi:hypothetical protein
LEQRTLPRQVVVGSLCRGLSRCSVALHEVLEVQLSGRTRRLTWLRLGLRAAATAAASVSLR